MTTSTVSRRIRTTALALAVLLAALGASALGQQAEPPLAPSEDADPSRPDGSPRSAAGPRRDATSSGDEAGAPVWTGQSVVASVNGEAITAADVEHQARLLGAPPEAMHTVRRLIAEQILLASEARRLGVELTEIELDGYLEEYLGRVPDFEESAQLAGTTAERQRRLAEHFVLSRLYLLHRVGLRASHGQLIAPDPLLTRIVTVTPGQLRELFRENRERFARPATVEYAVWACTDVAAAETVRDALGEGRQPEGDLPVREIVPVDALDDAFAGLPGLAEFLAEVPVGSVSAPVAVDGAVLVLLVTDRQEARAADFAEVQDDLRRQVQSDLLRLAQAELVGSLARTSFPWPPDLFQHQVGSAAGSRPGAEAFGDGSP